MGRSINELKRSLPSAKICKELVKKGIRTHSSDKEIETWANDIN